MEAPAQPASAFLTESGSLPGSDGTAIHYTFTRPLMPSGEGAPTLVFCNGIAMDTSLWQHYLTYFRQHLPTLIWDYRGHGLSQRPHTVRDLAIEDHCRDLHGLLDSLKIESGVFLGHSMGVQVILEFYHQWPECVRGLIPICGSFEDPLKTVFHTGLFKHAFPPLYSFLTRYGTWVNPFWRRASRSLLMRELLLYLGTNRVMSTEHDFLPYLRNLSVLDLEFFFHVLRGASEHSARSILKTVQVPTLVIAGEDDHFTPLKQSEIMAEEIPHAEFLVIPQGSHCSLLDQPELLNLKTEKFLQALGKNGQKEIDTAR